MSVSAISIQGVSKRYGDVLAVDRLDLEVARGEIFGFLGLNGAGKTTTIRALLGMITPSAGGVEVLGTRVTRGGGGPWQQIGHLVERPAAYPELSVWENLEVSRRLYGVRNPAATTHVAERLGLGAQLKRRARVLSTGNLQRLALARALLHEPELLILDEPANGLDPAGVVEVRELLRTLVAERGTTIFMSSHALAEVDRIATRIGIIHEGRLLEELDARELERHRERRLVIEARDCTAAHEVLRTAGYTLHEQDGGLRLSDLRAVEAPDDVVRALMAAGIAPTRVAVEQEDLELHFLRRVGRA